MPNKLEKGDYSEAAMGSPSKVPAYASNKTKKRIAQEHIKYLEEKRLARGENIKPVVKSLTERLSDFIEKVYIPKESKHDILLPKYGHTGGHMRQGVGSAGRTGPSGPEKALERQEAIARLPKDQRPQTVDDDIPTRAMDMKRITSSSGKNKDADKAVKRQKWEAEQAKLNKSLSEKVDDLSKAKGAEPNWRNESGIQSVLVTSHRGAASKALPESDNSKIRRELDEEYQEKRKKEKSELGGKLPNYQENAPITIHRKALTDRISNFIEKEEHWHDKRSGNSLGEKIPHIHPKGDIHFSGKHDHKLSKASLLSQKEIEHYENKKREKEMLDIGDKLKSGQLKPLGYNESMVKKDYTAADEVDKYWGKPDKNGTHTGKSDTQKEIHDRVNRLAVSNKKVAQKVFADDQLEKVHEENSEYISAVKKGAWNREQEQILDYGKTPTTAPKNTAPKQNFSKRVASIQRFHNLKKSDTLEEAKRKTRSDKGSHIGYTEDQINEAHKKGINPYHLVHPKGVGPATSLKIQRAQSRANNDYK